MSSTGSSGPARSISSIREDAGSNINDVLELGRMLAAHLENYNTVGQWMAYHLAELIVTAQDDATITVEQRQQIVEIILKVWAHRCYYPGEAPLEEFSSVFVALDRLGNDDPWKFSQLFDTDAEVSDLGASGLPLIGVAAELERLTRETLIRLIWLAARDAREKNRGWLEAADKVASNLESDVTTTLWRLRRRIAHHRLGAEEGGPKDVAEIATVTTAKDASIDGEAEDVFEGPTENAAEDSTVESGLEDGSEGLINGEVEDESNPLSDGNHVKRLREMADLLNLLADSLSTSVPSNQYRVVLGNSADT
ncbi:hypothetical protein [Sphaerisporangium sp. NPDC051011]|uniref:hypothetical protein n=1 Tax=Sphaerisporangium sp. NPDC051011 TaxID=3155792 RepID=UPI0033F343F2